MRLALLMLSLVPLLMAAAAPTTGPSRSASTQVIRVGPDRAAKRIADAARLAGDGDVIEVDAGTYAGDVASWPQSNLTIRAPRGRARILQHGESAEGKALWVIKGNNVLVENFEFSGAVVPDRNGAGIRHEGGKLTIRHCLFERNQMGVLTWNDERAELVIEGSEFRDNRVASEHRPGDPIGHQIYVGSIGRFTLRESYVHHGAIGHLVKSRARENRIMNNRLTDESGGRASYELEFPSGGIAYVVGNIIQQSADTVNRDIVSFGAEGYRWERNELYLVHNTLVDDLPSNGNFVRVRDGAGRVVAIDNLLLGRHALDPGANWQLAGNAHAGPGDVPGAARMDYRLARHSALVGTSVDTNALAALPLRLTREYVHPMQSRAWPAGPRSPGALQSLAN